jgi:N-acyl-L-homoserine lactone synthetase
MEQLERFKNTYIIRIANNDRTLDMVYNVRFQVYCEELRLEDKASFVDAREFDAYDDDSIQVLIQKKDSEEPIGCIRLVLKKFDLPIEKYCSHAFWDVDLSPKKHSYSVEISRLSVLKTVRTSPDAYLVSNALIMSTLFLSKIFYRNAYAMMEPRLARRLNTLGIPTIKIGDVIEYHGKRAPYFIDYLSFFKDLQDPDILILYEAIKNSLV